MKRLAAVALMVCRGAFSQEFEVATIKPAPPPAGPIRIGPSGGPGTSDPSRLDLQFVTLRQLLTRAYNVKPYQISGPSTLDAERFNVTAKVPEGSTKEQVNIMLQNLLAERFKATIHRETKELPAYALLVGKNGPKLRPAEEIAAPAGDAKALPPPRPPGNGPPMMPPRELGKDGFPQMPAGAGRGGNVMMMMPGRMKMSMSNQTMAGLCDILANQLDRPVVDLTQLTGKYDFTLAFSTEGLAARGPMGLPLPPPGGRGGAVIGPGIGPGGGEGHPDAADLEPAPSLLTAVQEQLGLKLDARKSQVELIVVDHVEKTPTDN